MMLVGVEVMPCLVAVPLLEPAVSVDPTPVLPDHADMASGYAAMADENCRLAEESLPVALEEWPEWESR